MNALKKIIILTVLLLPYTSGQLFAQAEKISVRVPISTRKSLTSLPLPIYRENLKNDSLDLEVDQDQFNLLIAQYPGLKVVPAGIELDYTDMASNLQEALTFTKYPTYPQYDSMMHYFANTFPSICRIDTFGYSTEGRLLLAVKISDNVEEEEDEPAFLYTSTMHGNELVGYILTLRLIDFILNNYQSDPEITRIVNDLEIWINPLSNPDMTFYGGDLTVANSIRYKFVDLNRDFPAYNHDDANDTAGVYPENQYMMLFLMEHEFNLSANLHSGAEVVNYPWDHKYELHPDDDWYRFISREYTDLAHDVNQYYMAGDGFTDGITNGADWYIISGGRQDYVNAYLHGREVTLELYNSKQMDSELLDTYWSYNQWSLISYMAQARYGIHGNVSSGNTGEALQAKVWVMNHDDETSWVQSDSASGNFYRYLKEGTYDLIFYADGYLSDTARNVEVIDYQKTELNIQLDSIGTGINRDVSIPRLNIYPNPATNLLYISGDRPFNEDVYAEMYDLDGKKIIEKKWPAGVSKLETDVSSLESGYYLIKLREGDNTFYLRFVIK